MKEEICENCYWWDFGFCDRIGKTRQEDDSCPKWRDSGERDDGR